MDRHDHRQFAFPALASLIVWAVSGRSSAGAARASSRRCRQSLPGSSNRRRRPSPALAITAKTFVIGNAIAIVGRRSDRRPDGRSGPRRSHPLPWVNMFISAPLSALVPVIMVLFGLGETTIILTVVLFAIWIIVLDTRAGVRAISPRWSRWRGASAPVGWQAFTKIYLWAALPEILAGIRLGLIRAVKGVVIGQLLVSIVGFGAAVRALLVALPDGAFLGAAVRPLRLRLRCSTRRSPGSSAGSSITPPPRPELL